VAPPAIQQEVARRQSSPCTGKLSARPARKPGDFLIAKESLRRSLPRHLLPAHIKILRRLSMRFLRHGGIYLVRWGFKNQNQPLGRDRAASRRSAPNPGKRTRREEHVPSHRPQMSSGRLFLDRVARQHCPSPLHRHEQHNMCSPEGRGNGDISTLPAWGHFYFALTRKDGRLTIHSDFDITTLSGVRGVSQPQSTCPLMSTFHSCGERFTRDT